MLLYKLSILFVNECHGYGSIFMFNATLNIQCFIPLKIVFFLLCTSTRTILDIRHNADAFRSNKGIKKPVFVCSALFHYRWR